MRAFWSYDLFPFVLSGTVDETWPMRDGCVKVKEYSATFRAICILPDDVGQPIHDKLVRLRIEHEEARLKLREEFFAKVVEVAPFMKGKVKW